MLNLISINLRPLGVVVGPENSSILHEIIQILIKRQPMIRFILTLLLK